MIVLDTNVVSAAMGPNRINAIIAWIDRYPLQSLYLTATVLAELRLGLAIMPDGRRRMELTNDLDTILDGYFTGRILPFDARAAGRYAVLVATAQTTGMAIGVGDGQIAAVAHIHGFAVATRETAPFLAAGVPVIDPWQQP